MAHSAEQDKKIQEVVIPISLSIFIVFATIMLIVWIIEKDNNPVRVPVSTYRALGFESLMLEMSGYCKYGCGVTSPNDPNDMARKDWIEARMVAIEEMFDCGHCYGRFECCCDSGRYNDDSHAHAIWTDGYCAFCDADRINKQWANMTGEEREKYFDILRGRKEWRFAAWLERAW